VLAERLAPEQIAVLNAGISGARLLHDKVGAKVADRLGRDVLDQPGVRTMIGLIGINDIAWPGTEFAPRDPPVRIADLMAGYRDCAARAHARGVRVIAAALTPPSRAPGLTARFTAIFRPPRISAARRLTRGAAPLTCSTPSSTLTP